MGIEGVRVKAEQVASEGDMSKYSQRLWEAVERRIGHRLEEKKPEVQGAIVCFGFVFWRKSVPVRGWAADRPAGN